MRNKKTELTIITGKLGELKHSTSQYNQCQTANNATETQVKTTSEQTPNK